MQTESNKSLKPYNTFGIDVKADQFVSVQTLDDLRQVLQKTYASELFIIGGGSNMLLTKDLAKTVVHIALKGREIQKEDEDSVLVSAKAGENWHDFVLWCLQKDFGGIENLSLIPGNVGTTPIQNIGAYGVELKDVFHSCEAIDVQTLETKIFSKSECQFGYRESVFKNSLKGKYIITKVVLKLTKRHHTLHLGYGAIKTELANQGIESPTIQAVSKTVIGIRNAKLPNPKELGNSGSFFKNPIVSQQEFSVIQAKHPEIPSYTLENGDVKIPAGWLIDQAGYKGYRKDDAGVHAKQALVLVNYGCASGREILDLALEIKAKIQSKYGVTLDFEVNII